MRSLGWATRCIGAPSGRRQGTLPERGFRVRVPRRGVMLGGEASTRTRQQGAQAFRHRAAVEESSILCDGDDAARHAAGI